MARFEDIETFVRVARTQSFGEAARQLRVVKSVVSRRIKKLEDFVGAPLFHRSTRTVRLSDVGQALLPNRIGLMNRANDVLDQMRGAREGPEGSLKVHVVPGFVLGDFASLIHRFQSAYPAIRLELMVSDEIVDPINAGFD
jgi:DNA-binding transcriptional LysR family regulator